MSGYDAQVRQQLAQARGELAVLQQRVARAIARGTRYRNAWARALDREQQERAGRARAEAERAEAAQLSHQYRNAAEQAVARIASARAIVADVRAVRSEFDPSLDDLDRILAALDGPS